MHTSSLQPPPPPQVNPSWLCYPVLMSVRSPLLCGSALFLTASQTHAVTQPHSACLFTISPLGPSAFCFFRFFSFPASRLTIGAHQSAAYDRPACSEAEPPRQDTPPRHTSQRNPTCNMASCSQPRQLARPLLPCAAAQTDRTRLTVNISSSLSVKEACAHIPAG